MSRPKRLDDYDSRVQDLKSSLELESRRVYFSPIVCWCMLMHGEDRDGDCGELSVATTMIV